MDYQNSLLVIGIQKRLFNIFISDLKSLGRESLILLEFYLKTVTTSTWSSTQNLKIFYSPIKLFNLFQMSITTISQLYFKQIKNKTFILWTIIHQTLYNINFLMGNQCCSPTEPMNLEPLTQLNLGRLHKVNHPLKSSLLIDNQSNSRNLHSITLTNLVQTTFKKQKLSDSFTKDYTVEDTDPQQKAKQNKSPFAVNLSDGSIYQGVIKDKKKQGKGRQILTDGSLFQGSYKNDLREGYGKIVYPNGDSYEGQWKSDKANGKGTYKSVDGTTSTGFWVDDLLEGEGEQYYEDGSIFQGNFEKGKKNGKGKTSWPDKSSYEGQFSLGNMHGHGVYIWQNQRYQGQWKNNKMDGFGTFQWSDGRKYIGQYKEGLKHGYGQFLWPDGKTYKGLWQKGNWIKGIFISKQGNTREVQNKQNY